MTGLVASEQIWWYVARSSGIVALVLTGLAVIWGLFVSTRVLQQRPPAAWLLALHRFLGLLAVVFTGVHVLGLVLDGFVHFGWAEVLVPFASSWRPGAVAWGVVSMYLLAAVQLSSMLMKRIPRRWWKRIHLSSFVLFWTAVVHGVTAGTDATNPLFVATTAAMTMTVVFLTTYRALVARRSGGRSVPGSRRPLAVG